MFRNLTLPELTAGNAQQRLWESPDLLNYILDLYVPTLVSAAIIAVFFLVIFLIVLGCIRYHRDAWINPESTLSWRRHRLRQPISEFYDKIHAGEADTDKSMGNEGMNNNKTITTSPV